MKRRDFLKGIAASVAISALDPVDGLLAPMEFVAPPEETLLGEITVTYSPYHMGWIVSVRDKTDEYVIGQLFRERPGELELEWITEQFEYGMKRAFQNAY